MSSIMISIATNYSKTPAGRYEKDGPYSGERFRNEYLLPALRKEVELVQVDLDGALGFGSSFLEEAFGGLVRLGYKAEELHKRLKIKSAIKKYHDRIWRYIDEESARRVQAHA